MAPRKSAAIERDDDRVDFTGLFQCCMETIGDLYPDGQGKIAEQGQTLQCKYVPDRSTHRMIFKDGVWRADLPEDPAPPKKI